MILFLNILKFIGFLLLICLILILFIVIFILFIPIKYSIFAEKYDTIKVNAKIACLFNIIKYEYIYKDNNQTYSLKIFGFELKERKKKKEKKKLFKNKKQKDVQRNSDNKISENIEDNIYKDKKIDSVKNNSYNNKIHNKNKKKKEKNLKEKKLKEKNNVSLKERYLYLKNYPDKKKIFNITKKLISRLFHAVKYKKLNLEIKFGFNDPYLTGYVLGLFSSISYFLPFYFNVKGDFEKEIINFKVETKGIFNLCSILLPILVFVLSKPIWKIIRKKDIINE